MLYMMLHKQFVFSHYWARPDALKKNIQAFFPPFNL